MARIRLLGCSRGTGAPRTGSGVVLCSLSDPCSPHLTVIGQPEKWLQGQ